MGTAALIIIDVQKGIDEVLHWGGNRNNPDAELNIVQLKASWQLHHAPIMIIQHCSTSVDSPFHPARKGNELKKLISIHRNDVVIKKETPNAFVRTSLQNELSRLNVDTLVITGFVTNNSVESTARMAGVLGYRTIVVSDACACFDKQGIDGSVYPAELIHTISLSNLNGEYAIIKSTAEVLDQYNKNGNFEFK